MDINIKGATGNGYGAKVSNSNRLHTDSVTRTQSQQAALNGDAFNISTGSITLTTATVSGVLYIKNEGDYPLVVKEIGVRIGASTGGTGAATVTLTSNPTSGTLISGALALSANSNRNLGSAKALIGEYYKGAQGATVVGGQTASTTATSNFTDALLFNAEVFVLPKGTSLAVSFTPPTSNTSQTIVVFGTLFYETTDI